MTLQNSPTDWLGHNPASKEDDQEFRDFVESVSVSQQELAAIVSELEPPGAVVAEGDATDERDRPMPDTPARLREFQRRFQHGWEQLAAAFSSASAPNYHPRALRKLKV